MFAELEGYDWAEAFAYAGEELESRGGGPGHQVDPVPGATVSAAPFSRNDVAELIGISEGENDERDWIVAGRLSDGRWFIVRAGCDYTGWGCRDWGNASVADDRESLIRLGMSDNERARLGFSSSVES